MFPLDLFYVEMCNWAHRAIEAESLLDQLSDEQVLNLALLVRHEIGGREAPVMLALVRAMVDDELRKRSEAAAS